jgi:hypothetical protein
MGFLDVRRGHTGPLDVYAGPLLSSRKALQPRPQRVL